MRNGLAKKRYWFLVLAVLLGHLVKGLKQGGYWLRGAGKTK